MNSNEDDAIGDGVEEDLKQIAAEARSDDGADADDDDDAGHAWKYVSPAAAASFVAPSSGGGGGGGGVLVSAFGAPLTRLPVPSRLFSFGGGGGGQVRSIHWSPYDPVGVVNADP